MGERVGIGALYVGGLVAYGVLREREVIPVWSSSFEATLLIVTGALAGLAIGSWWALALPIIADLVYLCTIGGVGPLQRLDLDLYLLYVTLPFMWVGVASGVGTRSILRHVVG